LVVAGALVLGLGTTVALVAVPPAGASPPVGSVLAWGDNYYGYLGNGSTAQSLVPTQTSLPAGTIATSVASSHFSSLAITSTGSLLAWGSNVNGQLGIGTLVGPDTCNAEPCSDTPVAVALPAGTIATAAASGHNYDLAATSTGQVYAWGYNNYGELGDGTTADSDAPMAVPLPAGTDVTAVTAGHDTSYALTSTGQIYAWGYNANGQLGIGNDTGPDSCGGTPCSTSPVAVQLPAGVTITAIAAGARHVLALASTGQIYAWGYNFDGQLGNGTTTNSFAPVAIQLPAGVTTTAVAAGHFYSLALTSTGQVYAWGENYDGQLGVGTSTGPQSCGGNPCSTTPVAVQLPAGVVATAVAGGGGQSLALTSTGGIYAWGYNGNGQLGNNSDTGPDTCNTDACSTTPVAVQLPAGVAATAVAAGNFYSLALLAPPSVTSVSPSSGPGAGGTSVTITGANFSAVSAVDFDGQAATSVHIVNSTEITAVSPAHAAGTVDVTVTTPNGTSATSPADQFTFGPTGYDLAGSDGGVFVFPVGQASGFFGSLPGLGVKVNNVVGIVPTNNFTGYNLVGSDGGVFVFPVGQTQGFFGSLPGLGVKVSNVVGIVPTNNFNGYDLVGNDGGVFVFPTGQTTGFFGSLPGLGVHVSDIVGIVATPGGGGYFLVGKDGGVFTFGNAPFLGSLPGIGVTVSNITGIASTPDGKGYYLVGSNGGVYAFGDATSHGSLPGLGVTVSNIVSIVPTPDGGGYWLIGSDGGTFAFGDAVSQGSLPGLGVHVNNIVGAVPTG
jgi:alpha-tubulin suppressor-like RCC1 family protein